MPRLFLPYIVDKDGKSQFVDGINQPMQVSIAPRSLKHTPAGWEENTINFVRHNEYLGLVRSFITQLMFHIDGARIIREFYYLNGVNAELYFIWMKQNLAFGKNLVYDPWYKGRFDFTTIKDKHDGVEVSLKEGGLSAELQANKATTYELPFEYDAWTVKMEGMNLYFDFKYSTVQEEIAGGVSLIRSPTLIKYETLPTFSFISSESGVAALETNSQIREDAAPNTTINLSASINYFIYNTDTQVINQEVSFKFVANILVKVIDPGSSTPKTFDGIWKMEIVNNAGVVKQLLHQRHWQQNYIASLTIPDTISIDTTFNLSIQPNEKLFVRISQQHINGGVIFTNIAEQFTSFNYKYQFKDTIIDAYRAIQVGDKLCRKISGGRSGLNSQLLTNDENLMITSGDALRGLSGSVIKTTFQAYHKSIDAVKCVAFGIKENNGSIESRAAVFADLEIANLGESSMPVVETAVDYIYGGVEVGYPSKDLGGVNGKYQFNVKNEWATPIQSDKRYTILSEYLSDPYIIEIARLNLESKKTVDGNTDNDVFFLDCQKTNLFYDFNATFEHGSDFDKITINAINLNLEIGRRFGVAGSTLNTRRFTIKSVTDDGASTIIQTFERVSNETTVITFDFSFYSLYREPMTIEGIPSDSKPFNIRLSPRRIMGHHFRWLRGLMYGAESGNLTFLTSERNRSLKTTDINGAVVDEDADIPISSMGTGIVLPMFFSFEVKSPYNLLELMESGDGYFKASAYGYEFNGYPWDIRTNDATLETQEYKLMLGYNNDLTKLINR